MTARLGARIGHAIGDPAVRGALLVATCISAAAAGRPGWWESPPPSPPALREHEAPRLPASSALPTRRSVVVMRGRESLRSALARGGLDAPQAAAAASALSDEFDTVNPHPGLVLALQTTAPGPGGAGARLSGLSFAPSAEVTLRLWRRADGALAVRRTELAVTEEPALVQGVVDGSLYLSLARAAVDASTAARVEALFGRRLDLGRDLESGDRFRLLLLQRRVGDVADGAPELMYAELDTRGGRARLYRSSAGGGAVEYSEGNARPRPASALLRTPVAGARITSGFGLRLHPILGFTRMHQGVDFAAPAGSPVLAAGDGVVEEARWAGGYGRWLKVRHASGLETGYAHLSAWAPGVAAGRPVRQGEVVAYVGASGLATGPHLHFEVFQAGIRVDPQRVQLAAPPLPGADEPALRARKAALDALVASLDPAAALPAPPPRP